MSVSSSSLSLFFLLLDSLDLFVVVGLPVLSAIVVLVHLLYWPYVLLFLLCFWVLLVLVLLLDFVLALVMDYRDRSRMHLIVGVLLAFY
jgi:hypothetical protein